MPLEYTLAIEKKSQCTYKLISSYHMPKKKTKKKTLFLTDGKKSTLFLFVCEWSAAFSRVWQAVAGAAGGILVLRRGQQPGAPTMAHEIRSSQVALLGGTPLPPSRLSFPLVLYPSLLLPPFLRLLSSSPFCFAFLALALAFFFSPSSPLLSCFALSLMSFPFSCFPSPLLWFALSSI